MLNLTFHPFPQLSTDRLVLRQINNNDVYDVFALRSDKKVMEFISRPLARSIEDVQKLIEIINDAITNLDGITWAITMKEDLKLIGTIGYWRMVKENYRAEIGYLLHPAFQGKGIMQEAITEVLKYGFQTIKLHSVEANVDPGNITSVKLLERNKFVKEAYFKENYYYDGKFLDSAIYSLLTPVQ